jgi:hypothetical protein
MPFFCPLQPVRRHIDQALRGNEFVKFHAVSSRSYSLMEEQRS